MRIKEPAASCRGLFCLLLLLLSAAPADAAMRLSLFGVGTSSSLKYYSDTGSALAGPVEAQFGYGGGLALEFPMGYRAGFELGAIYLARRLRDTTVDPNLVSTYAYLQIPLQLRIHLFRAVSLGIGGYLAQALGTIRDQTGGSTAYPDAGYRKLDYGLVGSLAIRPLGGALFIEGRYVYGLSDEIDHGVADATNSALASERARWREIQVLIGLRFGAPK